MSAFSDAAVEIVKSIANTKKAASEAVDKGAKGGAAATAKTSGTTMLILAFVAFLILSRSRR
jgi:hypothetical protein